MATEQQSWPMKRVVAASSAGTAFEWYDFFIFGSLATTIQKVFFAGLDPTAGLIAALGLFAAGFAFRPLGAIIFGVIGDRLGRKGAFLATVSLMGGATFAIGLLPTYATAGILSPILLILLRIAQGIALGGEYGGAAIYVAEHAPNDKRGAMTGWIQITAQLGLIADSAKPLKGFLGAGVVELVESFDGNAYRAVYTTKLEGCIYVLHAFQKKSHKGRKTDKGDVDLIEKRLKVAVEIHESKKAKTS